jgi:hypothetical protein
MLNQTHVEITKIIRENVETDSCTYGDSAMLMFKTDQEVCFFFIYLFIMISKQDF